MAFLPKLFDNPEYSDITIKFGDQEIKAHKMVICKRLKYFENLCGATSRFHEAGLQTIELHDDDPDALRAMLGHLYDREYSHAYNRDLILDVKVYCVAAKYGCEELMDLSARHIVRDRKGSINTLLEAITLVLDANHGSLADILGQAFDEAYLEATILLGDELDQLDTDEEPDTPSMRIQKQLLEFISDHPELGAHIVPMLKNGMELESVVLNRCDNCGKVSSECHYPNQCEDCSSDVMPAAYFCIKTE